MSLFIKALFSDYINSQISTKLDFAKKEVDADRLSKSVDKVWQSASAGEDYTSSFFRTFESFSKGAIKKTLKERVEQYNAEEIFSKKKPLENFDKALKNSEEGVKKQFPTLTRKVIDSYLSKDSNVLTKPKDRLGEYFHTERKIKSEKSSQDADFKKQINDLATKYGVSPQIVERMVYDSIFEASSNKRTLSYDASMKLMGKESKSTKELHLRKVEENLQMPIKVLANVFNVTEEVFTERLKNDKNVNQILSTISPLIRSLASPNNLKAVQALFASIKKNKIKGNANFERIVGEFLVHYRLDKAALRALYNFFASFKPRSAPDWYNCLITGLLCAKEIFELKDDDKSMVATLKSVIGKKLKINENIANIDRIFSDLFNNDKAEVLSTTGRAKENIDLYEEEDRKHVTFLFAREQWCPIDITLSMNGDTAHSYNHIISRERNVGISDFYKDIKIVSGDDVELNQLIQFASQQNALMPLKAIVVEEFKKGYPLELANSIDMRSETESKKIKINSDGSVDCIYKVFYTPEFREGATLGPLYVTRTKIPVEWNVTFKRNKGQWHIIDAGIKVIDEKASSNSVPIKTQPASKTQEGPENPIQNTAAEVMGTTVKNASGGSSTDSGTDSETAIYLGLNNI